MHWKGVYYTICPSNVHVKAATKKISYPRVKLNHALAPTKTRMQRGVLVSVPKRDRYFTHWFSRLTQIYAWLFFLFAVWPRGLGQGWARQKLSRLDVRAILGYRARDLSHGAYSVQRVHSERLQTGSWNAQNASLEGQMYHVLSFYCFGLFV